LVRFSQTIRLWLVFGQALVAFGQGSSHALRFFGTGVGPPGQQDRALFAQDDNEPGPAGQTAIDLGAGSFTLELWLRGYLADNASSNNGGDLELFDYSWINGNIILDRDIWCGSERKYGVSIAGGFVQFGTAGGDAEPFDSEHTLEGNEMVLDGEWHHVAVVRDVADGRKFIYVDGQLDMASSTGVSQSDLSYPDAGVPVTPGQCFPGQLTPYGWFLVLGAEKHDAGEAYPSFNGYIDELRLWDIALSGTTIDSVKNQVLPGGTPNLVGYYRFEKGNGQQLFDSSSRANPAGTLVAGTPGNGQWVAFSDDPTNTAPISKPGCLSLQTIAEAWSNWPAASLTQLVTMVNQRCLDPTGS